jgi:hypothetical protein
VIARFSAEEKIETDTVADMSADVLDTVAGLSFFFPDPCAVSREGMTSIMPDIRKIARPILIVSP